jgi:transcriptional regulator of acetoin/glycerol metabolism
MAPVIAFIAQKSIDNLQIDDEVINRLLEYPWQGNIRELRNIIDYMIAVCDKEKIDLSDLPQDSFFSTESIEDAVADEENEEIAIRGDYLFVLKTLYDLMEKGITGSRKAISNYAIENNINLSEQMVRYRLDELEKMGYVKKSKGKQGTTLTHLGIQRVKKLK